MNPKILLSYYFDFACNSLREIWIVIFSSFIQGSKASELQQEAWVFQQVQLTIFSWFPSLCYLNPDLDNPYLFYAIYRDTTHIDLYYLYDACVFYDLQIQIYLFYIYNDYFRFFYLLSFTLDLCCLRSCDLDLSPS